MKANTKSLMSGLTELRSIFEESAKDYDKESNDFWNSFSKEDQMKLFHAVVSRIHKGDVIDIGSYRYVLYDVFGFGPESYIIGMDCGYLDIHNLIGDGVDKRNKNKI